MIFPEFGKGNLSLHKVASELPNSEVIVAVGPEPFAWPWTHHGATEEAGVVDPLGDGHTCMRVCVCCVLKCWWKPNPYEDPSGGHGER